MCGQQRTGGASGCLGCDGCYSGFQPHPWRSAPLFGYRFHHQEVDIWFLAGLNRFLNPPSLPSCSKACVTCGCSGVDHVPGGDAEDDQHMGRLLAGTPCAHLTTKVKGGGGLRTYKRNRMIVTNPVVSRKDPTFSTTTYDWAPAGLSQTLVSGVRRHQGEGFIAGATVLPAPRYQACSLTTLLFFPSGLAVHAAHPGGPASHLGDGRSAAAPQEPAHPASCIRP